MEVILLSVAATLLGFLLIALTRPSPSGEEAPPFAPTPLLQTLERIPEEEFEALVTALVRRVGLEVERVWGRQGSILEILAKKEGPIVGGRYLIQAVRPPSPDRVLDSLMVRYLYEVAREEGVQKAVLLTTGVFTDQALALAEEKGLELIDGQQLARLLQEHGLQVADVIPLPQPAAFGELSEG